MKRYEQGSVGMRPDPEGSWCGYAEAKAEIERLRYELTVEKGWVSQYRDAYGKHIIEIEQLSGRIQMAEAERDAANSLAKNRHTEIERLRKELAEKDDYIRTVSRPIGAHSYE